VAVHVGGSLHVLDDVGEFSGGKDPLAPEADGRVKIIFAFDRSSKRVPLIFKKADRINLVEQISSNLLVVNEFADGFPEDGPLFLISVHVGVGEG
jgi:hypothetical protein